MSTKTLWKHGKRMFVDNRKHENAVISNVEGNTRDINTIPAPTYRTFRRTRA